MSGWDAVWARRELPGASGGSLLADLLAADGFDSTFAGVGEAAWTAEVHRVGDALGLHGAGTSVFEVGCGAGAFLLELERRGCAVSGLDRSPALIGVASRAMPSGSFAVADAADTPPEPTVNVALSFGVFLYFDSDAYAGRVLDRMVAKARRAVAVFDLPDRASREADLARRTALAGGPEAYAERYATLDHRYYDREAFAAGLRERGLVDIHVEDAAIAGYGNAPFRFNAWGFVPG